MNSVGWKVSSTFAASTIDARGSAFRFLSEDDLPELELEFELFFPILILAFVVIIIGGIGSIRGAFIAALLVGLIDTVGRAFLPDLLRIMLASRAASTVAPAMSSMMIYLLMAIVLVPRPEGLFPVSGK